VQQEAVSRKGGVQQEAYSEVTSDFTQAGIAKTAGVQQEAPMKTGKLP
jgi:hypothetical protein